MLPAYSLMQHEYRLDKLGTLQQKSYPECNKPSKVIFDKFGTLQQTSFSECSKPSNLIGLDASLQSFDLRGRGFPPQSLWSDSAT